VAALELPGRPNAPLTARVVLLHDYESLWIYDAQPHHADASYWRQTALFYSALRSLGVDVDVRHPDHDLDGYDLVVAPAIQLVGEERAEYLEEAAQNALFLAGPRFAYRTSTGRVHEDGQPGPLTNLLGCKLQNVDAMRPGLHCHVGTHRVEIWAESYRLLGGEATHVYTDGPMAGAAAVVRHGNAVTLGAWSPTLIREVLGELLTERGIAHEPLPEGVRVARRGETATWMNFNQEPATLPDGSVLGPVAFEQRRA
jgi:beta-galactosidase